MVSAREFQFTREHERFHQLASRTKMEKKFAEPVELHLGGHPRLLHEALAAYFILRPRGPPLPELSDLADVRGKPRIDAIRDVLRAHADQIQ